MAKAKLFTVVWASPDLLRRAGLALEATLASKKASSRSVHLASDNLFTPHTRLFTPVTLSRMVQLTSRALYLALVLPSALAAEYLVGVGKDETTG